MTALDFETSNEAQWSELEKALTRGEKTLDPERILFLYRTACEHLALAEARGFPAPLVSRLSALTARAHQIVYRQTDLGLGRIARTLMHAFPAGVRAHRCHDPAHTSASSLGGAAKGLRVGDFDLAHLLLGHLRAALADAERGERDVDSLGVRRNLLLESVHVDNHLGDLGVGEGVRLAARHHHHLPAQRVLDQKLHDVSAHVPRRAQHDRRVLRLRLCRCHLRSHPRNQEYTRVRAHTQVQQARYQQTRDDPQSDEFTHSCGVSVRPGAGSLIYCSVRSKKSSISWFICCAAGPVTPWDFCG